MVMMAFCCLCDSWRGLRGVVQIYTKNIIGAKQCEKERRMNVHVGSEIILKINARVNKINVANIARNIAINPTRRLISLPTNFILFRIMFLLSLQSQIIISMIEITVTTKSVMNTTGNKSPDIEPMKVIQMNFAKSAMINAIICSSGSISVAMKTMRQKATFLLFLYAQQLSMYSVLGSGACLLALCLYILLKRVSR